MRHAEGSLSAGFDKLGVPIDLSGSRERIWVIAEGEGSVLLQDVVDRA